MIAVREIRASLANAGALVAALGLKAARGATARQALVVCPWHADRTPSCSVRLAGDGTISVRCHGCGATGDALSLIAKVHGLNMSSDFREVLRLAAEMAGAPSLAPVEVDARQADDERPSDETYDRIWSRVLELCSPARTTSPSVGAYLMSRGIGADAALAGIAGFPRDGRALIASMRAVFERAQLEGAGFLRPGRDAFDWPDYPVLIPWRDRYGRIVCVQRRRLDGGTPDRPKYRLPRGRSPRAPFGVDALSGALEQLGQGAEVVVTEGALDCLARRRIARERGECAAVVGVFSASTPCAGLPLDLYEGRRVVLALDNDAAGDGACSKLVEVLRGIAGELVRERPEGAKDWLEALAGAGAAE